MTRFLPVLILILGVGALYLALHERADDLLPGDLTPADLRSDNEPAAGPGDLTSEGAVAVGVWGRSGPLPHVEGDPAAWSEGPVRFPPDATKITGRVMLDVLGAAVPVRFVSQGEMDAFAGHVFLDKPPPEEEMREYRMGAMREWVQQAGYVLEQKEGFVILRRSDEARPATPDR